MRCSNKRPPPPAMHAFFSHPNPARRTYTHLQVESDVLYQRGAVLGPRGVVWVCAMTSPPHPFSRTQRIRSWRARYLFVSLRPTLGELQALGTILSRSARGCKACRGFWEGRSDHSPSGSASPRKCSWTDPARPHDWGPCHNAHASCTRPYAPTH